MSSSFSLGFLGWMVLKVMEKSKKVMQTVVLDQSSAVLLQQTDVCIIYTNIGLAGKLQW